MKNEYYIPEVGLWVDRYYGLKNQQGCGSEDPLPGNIELAKFYISKCLRPRKTYNTRFTVDQIVREGSEYLETKIERGEFVAGLYESGYVPNSKRNFKVGFKPFFRHKFGGGNYWGNHISELYHTLIDEFDPNGKRSKRLTDKERYILDLIKKYRELNLKQSVPDKYKTIMSLHNNWVFS